jgi:hypothetical protein
MSRGLVSVIFAVDRSPGRVAGCREENAAQPGSYLLQAGARPAAVPQKRYFHPSIDILHCSSVCAVKIA